MNNYENIVNTLRCQIKRAQEKKNLIKADKLKKKLSVVNKLHKMAQKKKLDQQLQDHCDSIDSESESAMSELVSLQDTELSLQIDKLTNLTNDVNQLKNQADMLQVVATAFDHENTVRNADENEPEQLVSIQAGYVGNQIGANFWEKEEPLLLTNGSSSEQYPLINKQLRNTVQSDYCYNPADDSDNE